MTLIVVALISSVAGPTLLWWLNRREMKNRVGTPNGSGNLIEMVERIDQKQDAFVVLMADHTAQDARQFEELRAQLAEKSI